MIRFQIIKTSDADLYQFMEQLLTASFPEDEYRDLEELRKYTDTLPHFYNNIVFEDEKPIGILTYWDFDNFSYVEHFAIDPNQRNGGYGQKVLEHLKGLINQPIVLEVELPEEEMAKRRVNFYKRHGYNLWEKEYFQPSYKTGYNPLPMYLMVNGELNIDSDFEEVKKKIHTHVYGI
ncbi:MAG: GNAT family N-acetyltransferase [Bacteroides sp.]|nr:GNAT family N-acetyltransferase [Bacteroides sp.]